MKAQELIEGHAPIEPPAGVPVWDVDPYDPAILADPYPYYAELHSKGPFAYIPKYSALVCGRFAETRQVFTDWERFVSSRGVGLTDFALAEPWRSPSVVLEVDPPHHTVTRTAIARALSPRAVALLKEDFAASAARLLDAILARGGRIEAVADLAEAFPTDVFPRAVGLSQTDARNLVDYGAMVFNALGPDNDLRRAALAKAPAIVPWINARCARADLLPGGFGEMIYGAADAGEITEAQAGMLVRSLLSAGVDTTVTAIGNALWCLASNPDQYQALRDDPTKARNVFDETLRLTSPVHTFCRTAVAKTEISGITIPENAKILCVLGAANVDPAQWPDPLRFDIGRRVVGHLAFGAGIHGCVGQSVARAEGEAVFRALAERVGRIEFDGDAVWRPNNAIRALDRLPLRLVAA